jgi:uncharacterized protein YjaZ
MDAEHNAAVEDLQRLFKKSGLDPDEAQVYLRPFKMRVAALKVKLEDKDTAHSDRLVDLKALLAKRESELKSLRQQMLDDSTRKHHDLQDSKATCNH